MTKGGSAIASESMTNKSSKYTIYTLCKLYEKLSMLRSRSSYRTQLKLHSYLLLRFRGVHVPSCLFHPP
jgi:hypothetical protein